MPIDADKIVSDAFNAGKNGGVTVEVMKLPTYTQTEYDRQHAKDGESRIDKAKDWMYENVAPAFYKKNDGTDYEAFGVGKNPDYVNLYYAPERLNRRFAKPRLDAYDWAKTAMQTEDDYKLKAINQVSKDLGIKSNLLIDNPDLFKQASAMSEYNRNQAYMQGVPYSPVTVAKMFPEVDTGNPVEMASALRHYNDVLYQRSTVYAGNPSEKITAITSNPLYKLVVNSYRSSQLNNTLFDNQVAYDNGEITKAEKDKRDAYILAEMQKNAPQPHSFMENVISQGVASIPQFLKALDVGSHSVLNSALAKLAPELEAGMQMFPVLVTTGAMILGGGDVKAAGKAGAWASRLAAAAGGTAVSALGKSILYEGNRQMETFNAYREFLEEKKADGTPMYNERQAQNLAKRVGAVNGMIDSMTFDFTIGGMKKLFGVDAVKDIVENAAKRNSILLMGKKARYLATAKVAAKQFGLNVANMEIGSGVNRATRMIMENVYNSGNGTGNPMHGSAEIAKATMDEMINQLPGAVAMGGVTGGIAGLTFNARARGLMKEGMEVHRQEIERTNDNEMAHKLIAARDSSQYEKTTPGAFGKIVQNELDAVGKGKLYVDTEHLLKTDSGRQVLSEMIDRGMVTADEASQAIEKGIPLEIDSGTYFQLADDEMQTAIENSSSYDVHGMLLSEIQERRKAIDKAIGMLKQEVADREKSDVEHGDEGNPAIAEIQDELFKKGLSKIGEQHKELLERTKKEFSDLTGWTKGYKGMQGELGRRGILDEMEYILADSGDSYDDQKKMYLSEVIEQGKKKLAQIEWLENNTPGTFKDSLNADRVAMKLLPSDVYKNVYLTTVGSLKHSTREVKQSAKELALIHALTVDSFRRNYGVTVKAPEIYFPKDGKIQKGGRVVEFNGLYRRGFNAIAMGKLANKSTFIHETMHYYVSQMERLAKDETINADARNKIKHDLDVLNKYGSYKHNESNKKFTDTKLAGEFRRYTHDITHSKEGAKERLEAEERYKQESLARAFERYITEGVSPSKSLKHVFRRLKKWMLSIYHAVKNLGRTQLPKDLRMVFDKMLATDEEINEWAEERGLELLKEQAAEMDDVLDIGKSFAENVEKWKEDVKDEAKERVLKEYLELQTHKGKEVIDSIYNASKDAVIKEEYKRGEDLYSIEQQIEFIKEKADEMGIKDPEKFMQPTLSQAFERGKFKNATKTFTKTYHTFKEFYALERDHLGGTFKHNVGIKLKQLRKDITDSMFPPEVVRAQAEEMLESGNGKLRLANVEREIFESKLKAYLKECDKALVTLGRDKVSLESKKKVIKKLKSELGFMTDKELEEYAKARQKEAEKIERAEKEAKLEKKRERIKDFQAEVKQAMERIRKVRKSIAVVLNKYPYDPEQLKAQAEQNLADVKMRYATSWKWWNHKADKQAEIFANALKVGNVNKAAEANNNRMLFQTMASVARELDEKKRKFLHGTHNTKDADGFSRYGIKGIVHRISRDKKPRIITENTRYAIEKIAYQFKITDKPATVPIDGFSWETLASDLSSIDDSTTTVNGMTPEGASVPNINEFLPQWIIDIVNSDDKPQPIGNITLNDFESLYNAIDMMYHAGSRRAEPNSFIDVDGKKLTYAQAKDKLLASIAVVSKAKGVIHDLAPALKTMVKTPKEKAVELASKVVDSAALPEVLIGRLGEEGYNMIYLPVDAAYLNKRKLTMEASKKMKEIFGMYTNKEWDSIRNERKYQFTELSGKPANMTKEEVLCLALNMGTETNRDRLAETMGSDVSIVQKFLEKYMDDRDWDFVEAVQNHIASFFDEENRALVRSGGLQMKKEKGIDFVVKVTGKDGKTHDRTIHGQYYPIRYDSSESIRTSDIQNQEAIDSRSRMKNSMERGMGSTKKRQQNSGGQSLRRDLNVYTRHINDTINIITTREACTDVYRLLSDREVKQEICDVYGTHYYDWIRDWIRDSWMPPVEAGGVWKEFCMNVRGNAMAAVMGYRLSTAILNASNIFIMAHDIGWGKTIKAINDFYFHGNDSYFAKRRMIAEKSTYMANRGLARANEGPDTLRIPEPKSRLPKAVRTLNRGLNKVNKHAFTLIEETDYMLSLPLWYESYRDSLLRNDGLGLSPEMLETRAVLDADRAVRRTFGGNEPKDASAVAKSTIGKLFMPFYTYVNLIGNKFFDSFYAWTDGKPFNAAHVTSLVLNCWILPSIFEAGVRYEMDNLTTPDDDKKQSFVDRVIYGLASGGPIGALPAFNNAIPAVAGAMTGVKMGDTSMVAAGTDFLENVVNAAKIISGHGGASADWIDAGKEITRALNRTVLNGSDTLSDGMWAIMRMAQDDMDYTMTQAALRIALDKPIKKSKEQRKEEQREAREERKAEENED